MDRDLNQEEFKRFHDQIYQLAGIHYPNEKLALLSNRIRRRLRVTKLDTYEAYLKLLQGGANKAEVQEFVDAITTNETYFFRCQRHWDFFKEWLQKLKATNRRGPLRIWSAAASNGSEAYSIVITCQQVLGPNFGGMQLEVFATDLSATILEEAKAGVYRPYALAQTPPDVIKQYFEVIKPDHYEFSPKLKKHVTFQRHNLMEPVVGKQFDFVFLRNVMIYFDVPSKERVLNNAFAVTKPDGWLLVGESESLMNVKHPFVYKKPSLFYRPMEKARV